MPYENTTTFSSLEDLRNLVTENGGVLTIETEQVRNAYGKDRLGIHVRDNISKALAGMGLGHYPLPLPDRQRDPVRIYKLGSDIADIIDAVLQPSAGHDDELRRATGGDAAQLLARVREIIGP